MRLGDGLVGGGLQWKYRAAYRLRGMNGTSLGLFGGGGNRERAKKF